MRDRQPYPGKEGRVLITPEGGGTPFYATLEMADDAIDIGTPLNKHSLLKDTTASIFGLGIEALPDEVLQILGRFNGGLGNDYIWAKQKLETQVNLVPFDNFSISINFPENSFFISDKIENLFNLAEPITVVPYSDFMSLNGDTYVGKYFKNGTDEETTSQIYKFVKTVNITTDSGIYYTFGDSVSRAYASEQYVTYGYVNSPDPEAYPPAISDGYTYTPLGKIGSPLTFVTGRYVGTGKGGPGVYTKLKFSAPPKLVFVHAVDDRYTAHTLSPFVRDIKYGLVYTRHLSGVSVQEQILINDVVWSGNEIWWCSDAAVGGHAYNQLNDVDTAYMYHAIL